MYVHYKFSLSHRTSMVEKRLSVVSLGLPLHPVPSCPCTPSPFYCGMCQHLSWQKTVLDLKPEENSSAFMTSSAFTRPLVLLPQPAPQAECVVVGNAREGHMTPLQAQS